MLKELRRRAAESVRVLATGATSQEIESTSDYFTVKDELNDLITSSAENEETLNNHIANQDTTIAELRGVIDVLNNRVSAAVVDAINLQSARDRIAQLETQAQNQLQSIEACHNREATWTQRLNDATAKVENYQRDIKRLDSVINGLIADRDMYRNTLAEIWNKIENQLSPQSLARPTSFVPHETQEAA